MPGEFWSAEGMRPLERKTPWGLRDRPVSFPVRWAGDSSLAVRRKEAILEALYRVAPQWGCGQPWGVWQSLPVLKEFKKESGGNETWAVKVMTRRITDALARGEQLLFMSPDLRCGHSGGAWKAFGRGPGSRLGGLGHRRGSRSEFSSAFGWYGSGGSPWVFILGRIQKTPSYRGREFRCWPLGTRRPGSLPGRLAS